MKIFITGAAGFIGFSLAKKFLENGLEVFGIDNYDNYYDVKLKKLRIKKLKSFKKFKFYNIDITNFNKLQNLIKKIKINYVYHFAAQPGVRYSLIYPKKYLNVNIIGFQNLLRILEKKKLKAIIYASSSSVYGDQEKFPISEKADFNAKNPYGLSKIINEETAELYSNIIKAPIIGLRLFTVYGEWGRPDMYIIKMLNNIYKNKIFYLNNSGDHYRDFTYIKDVTEICSKLIKKKIKKKHLIFNICASNQINMLNLTKKILKKFPKSKIKNVKANKADVYRTFGDNKKIKKFIKFKKFTNINFGLKKTIEWYNLNSKYLK